MGTAESFRRLFKLNVTDGTASFTKVAEDKIAKSSLSTDDVFVLDTGAEVFAWVGKKASEEERKLALGYAQNYLTEYKRPAYISVCRIIKVEKMKSLMLLSLRKLLR